MIRKFETYIKESSEEGYETYDLMKICDDYMDTIERYELPNNDLLIRYLNKIILNKTVEFYQDLNPIYSTPPRENIPYRRVITELRFRESAAQPGKSTIKFFYDVPMGAGRYVGKYVDINKPIRVFIPKRIYSPEDPYGEEDWGVNEEFDLFGKKKKVPVPQEMDWKEQLKGSCYIDSLNDFFNNNCKGNEKTLIQYFDILCSDKDIVIQHNNERFRAAGVVLKKFWNKMDQNVVLNVYIEDNKGVEHILPAVGRIDFNLPQRKISKIDPYGEEDWEG